MYGFYCSLGKQGKGKTVFIVRCLINELKKGKRNIFSNITLYTGELDNNGNKIHMDYTPISFDIKKEKYKSKIINGKEVDVIDILDMIQDDEDYFNDSIMILDEIHIYFNSLDFMRKNNRIVQEFFSQLRKRNILLLATSQFLLYIDNRIRKQMLNCFQMEKLDDEKGIFQAEIGDIDGNWWKPISRETLILKDYYKYYNTNEIVH